MRITSQTQSGEHKGLKFSVTDGLLYVDGVAYTFNKVKRILEIITLLDADNITIVKDTKPAIASGLFGPYEIQVGDFDAIEDCNTPDVEYKEGTEGF